MAVLVDFEDRGEVAQNADSSSLKRGESFGFEAGEYPVTVVYDRPFENLFGDSDPKELGGIVIKTAPPDGERWYVTAYDSGNGLTFTVDTRWPEGV